MSNEEQPSGDINGFWCVIANVKHERLRPTGDDSGGEVVTQVIKACPPGRKVYVSKYWTWPGSRVVVVGKNRSGRWIRIVVRRFYLENFRAKYEYSPTARHTIENQNKAWGAEYFYFADRTEAETHAASLNRAVTNHEVETILKRYDPTYKIQVDRY